MSWLHNSPMSTLAHLDSDDTSDGSNLVSVNPQSVFPVHVVQNSHTQNLLSSENANIAAIRLLANCSSYLNSPENATHSIQQLTQVASQSILSQEHPTIRILSVQGKPLNSPAQTQNCCITSSRDSSHKVPQTFLLSTVDGSFPAGLTISSADLPVHITSGSHNVLVSPQKLHTGKSGANSEVLAKSAHSLISPSQASPILHALLQTGVQPQLYQQVTIKPTISSSTVQLQQSEPVTVSSTTNTEEKVYPKPIFSYSCLIALALKNSKHGSLPVGEIYSFMCENFPYFKTAPDGWKSAVRHNLSLNKCFVKVENPKLTQDAKKGFLWALNPTKIDKMKDEISKWSKKDPVGLLSSMAYPGNLLYWCIMEPVDNEMSKTCGGNITSQGQCHPVQMCRTEPTPGYILICPSADVNLQNLHGAANRPHGTANRFLGLESETRSNNQQYGTLVTENLEAIETGKAGLHYSKKKSPDSTPCTPIKAETAVKIEFTLDQKPEFSQIQLEKYNSNILFEKTEMKHPVKVEYSWNQQGTSPVIKQEFQQGNSTVIKQELIPLSPKTSFKIEPNDYSCTDIPVSFSNDALTDIVLQNSVWDDDLENNIDIDLI